MSILCHLTIEKPLVFLFFFFSPAANNKKAKPQIHWIGLSQRWDLSDAQVIRCPLSRVNFPRIPYSEKVNWLSLANGHTEPNFGCRKERSTRLSIKQDHIDGQHKTVFFSVVCIIITSCLHIEQLLHYCSTYKNIVRNLEQTCTLQT